MNNGTDERTAALSDARRALLEFRMRKLRAGEAPIPRRQDRGPAPLSFAQQRLWLLDQLVPGNYAYNVPRALRLKGALDVSALEKALDTIVERHEVLRTPFAWEDGSVVQVFLGSTTDALLQRIDLSHLAAPAGQAELSRRLVDELQRPFDLSRDVMLRATLFRLADEEHVLLVVTHHIASDGWSKGVLFRELSALYDAFATFAPSPLPELPIQYADFALWQRQRLQGEVLERLLAYYRAHLAGAPPALELPSFRQRPAIQTYRGEKQYPVLQKALSEQLKALAQREGVTLFMLLMAAFKALLYRYTGQGDVVVGTTIAGRTRQETEGLIGFFMNTLVLRTDLSDNPTFRELLQRERGVALGAYEHQEIPFEKLVEELAPERDRSRSPLIQVMFLLDTPSSLPILRGLEVTAVEVDTGAAKYDLILGFSEGQSGLSGKIEYNTDLFDAATITRFLGHFEGLLESVVEDASRRVLELSILRPEESAQLLGRWNQTRAEVPRDLCVHQLMEAQAARTPDAPAVIFEGQQISYRELSQRSRQLASYLRKRGVGPGVLVGIATSRSIDMVVGLFGILEAGGAYVPIDPTYPRDRIAFMLSDARVRVLVTEAATAALLPVDPGEIVRLDADAAAIARESAEPPESGVTATDLAYVIYTSGSTGQPKGVQIPHRAVVNFLTSMRDRPGISEKDAVYAVTSLSFDIAGLEIYLPLMVGARLVVVSREVASDGARLRELLDHPQHPCSFIQATPATFQLLLEAGWEGRGDLKILVGGEALRQDLADKLAERAGSVWNMYGPTETTIWSCVHALPSRTSPPVSKSPASIPPPPVSLALKAGPVLLGRPIANTELYILDAQLSPVPVGVAGELFIGGEGLARGYLRRPELTEQKFIRHPFRADASARLFRTGDLCRYYPDGSVDFLGRIDDQVKLRGFRIELGEIEAVLAAHPAVRQCVVVAREDAPGQRRLVAYLVVDPAAAPSTGDLRAHLQRSLPEIMVPSAFVVLPALPLTPNGKINRRGLPPPEASGRVEAAGAFVAPSGPIEEAIAAIWRELLRLPRISADENFFELGGHSLLAMRVISRVREVLGVEIPVRSLFEASTVAELSLVIAQALLDRSPIEELAGLSLARRQVGGPAPLSFSQQRIWFLEEMTPGTAVYNILMGMRVVGELDRPTLIRALDAIVARHEVLRTTFMLHQGAPVQIVHPDVPVAPRVIDLRELPQDEREGEAQRILREEARVPFDLSRDLMLRATLVQLDDEEHALFFVVHHIASDAWSSGVFFRELTALYGAFKRGAPSPLPELPIQYADFAAWQGQHLRGEILEAQLAYWREKLAGVPPLELPTDRPRPPVQTTRGATRTRALPKELVAPLRALGREAGATEFMTLLAAFQVLLHRYTGQEDISVGTPIAGRNWLEVEPLIGFFVNTLVMRTSVAGAPTFRELLRRVRDTAFDAFAHQDLPFEKLVEELRPERVTSRTPLFQVMFVFQNAARQALSLSGAELKPLGVSSSTGTAKFDLTVMVNEGPDGFRATFEYNTDLFDLSTIERMLGSFQVLLTGIVEDPDARVDRIPILTEQERRQLLVGWNHPTVEHPPKARIHEIVAEQARRTPEAVAVVFEGERLSYAALDRRANQLAHLLRQSGVGPDVLVGVCLSRSLSMIVALLGILKAGGAYVPLDPTYPADRLEFMLGDAKVPVVLTQERLTAVLPADSGSGGRVVRLDADRAEIDRQPETAVGPTPGEGPQNLAYVIYTSGSTGKPKGVMVTHHNVVRLFEATQRWYGFNARDVWTMFHSYAFDFSVWEIWGALFFGGRVVVVPYLTSRSPDAFYKLLGDEGVTVLNQTPSAFRQLVHAEESENRAAVERLKLRYVIFGGEALDLADLRPFWARHGDKKPALINMYGITETTVHVTYRPVGLPDLERPWSSVIGQVIPDLSVFILDQHKEPVPVGVRGELFVGGAGLAKGYLNRPDLTRERFIKSPFTADPEDRLYRTGDLARYLPSGDIEYLGRIDQQVKIRGHRIELGEIEAVLGQHPDAREVAVLVREDMPGDKRIVAYVVSAKGAAPSAVDLRAFLKQRLPDVMIPSAFVLLARLPLTDNGKIDRRALPKPEVDLRVRGLSEPAKSPTETKLASIWEAILGIKNVGSRDNFFELGGHSMLAVRMVAEIEKAFGKKIPLALLFENQTVEQLSRLLQIEEVESQRWPMLIAIQPKGTRRPLFCVSTFNVNALGYVALARNLGQDQPVYGLQSQYRQETVEPYQRHEFEALAREYIGAMKKVAPRGPYYFCGMCEGAHIAFEMARLLHEEGETIGLLGILDAFPIENTRRVTMSRIEGYRSRFAKRWRRLQKFDDRRKQAIYLGQRFRERVTSFFGRIAIDRSQSQKLDLATREQRAFILELRRRYWPGPDFVPPTVPCPIYLFRRPEQPYWRIKDPECGWGSRTTVGVEIHTIAGEHETILREPYVRVLAEKLNSCLLRNGVARSQASRRFEPSFAPTLARERR